MQNSVVTQAGFRAFKFALDRLANNLAAHVNASLAQAHGLNLMVGPIDDGLGNNLSTYQDSAGHVWGTRVLRIATPDGVFYAPANLAPGIEGQAVTNGLLEDSGLATPFDAVGGSSWVTEFISTDIEDTNLINDASLIPHTNLAHWETHGGTSVIARSTFDTHGDLVARYVAILSIAGIVYEIPCDPKIGGPPQLPRMGPFSPSSRFASGDIQFTITPVVLGGGQPITYAYEYYDFLSNSWVGGGSFPEAVKKRLPTNFGGFVDVDTRVTWHSANGFMAWDSVDYDDGAVLSFCRVRLTATNAAGSTHQDVNGSDLIFEFHSQAHD